jgi:predicted TIM-barrel fold metal-dependent hydrolase
MLVGTPWDGPVVDAHQHFWDPFRNHHPWLSGETTIPFRYGDYAAIRRPYLPPEYFADAAAHDIRETVYVETEWDPSDPLGETRYATGLAERHGVPNAIVAQAWLDRDDVADVLAGQASFDLVRGVRHKPGGPDRPDDLGPRRRTLMSDERWRAGYAQLERHHLHFDLQTPWWNLWEAVRLARDFPATTIVLNHTGLPADRSTQGLAGWHAAMSRLADEPNVVVKVSGLGRPGIPWTVEDNRWIVQETVAMFGPERIMFASNFPVDRLCGSFDAIFGGFKAIAAAWSQQDQRRLFYENARAIYRTSSIAGHTDHAVDRVTPARQHV